jgi:hypothetical protein
MKMKTLFTTIATATAVACGFINGSAANNYPQLTDVPTVYIDTENSVPITSRDTYVRATMRYVDHLGVTTYDDLNIRGRGNSTWWLEKKPYRLKFDKKKKLLGNDYANAKSWTLMANHADKTLIRNAVAACVGDFTGQPFTAAALFVDLVINGEYIGNYQISDQIDVRKNRVDITEQDEPMTDDSDITGGYLMEVDGYSYGEPVHFDTNKGVKITIKSPDSEVIDQRQINYIRDHVNDFEAALFSKNFTDDELGYHRYVDPETLASWYIASEVTGNPDCFWSTYMYKKQGDDKIYWGPLWDYDIAFNNCDRVGDVSRALMTQKGFINGLAELWVNRMWQDPWFGQLINERWKQLVDDGIEQYILDYIDKVAAEIDQSQQLNFSKWSINTHVYNEIVLFDTYIEGVNYLKNFVSVHCAYLTDAFADAADLAIITPTFTVDNNYLYHIENYGSHLVADVDGTRVVMRRSNDDAASQQWRIVPVDDTYFRIIHNATGKAVTDVATGQGHSYTPGTQLTIADVDASNTAQEWKFNVISTGNRYSLVNHRTKLAWNNSGGGTNEGNPIISYSSNSSDNENKPTRQWRIHKNALLESSITATKVDNNSPDYRVTYSPDDEMLHFRAANNPAMLTPNTDSLSFGNASDSSLFGNGTVNIYTMAGTLVASLPIATDISVAFLPSGIYIVSWQFPATSGSNGTTPSNGTITGTTKFHKN